MWGADVTSHPGWPRAGSRQTQGWDLEGVHSLEIRAAHMVAETLAAAAQSRRAGSQWSQAERDREEPQVWGKVLHSESVFWSAKWGREIKRRLFLGRKSMTNLDSTLKSRDITLPTKVRLVKAMVFPVVMYG